MTFYQDEESRRAQRRARFHKLIREILRTGIVLAPLIHRLVDQLGPLTGAS